MRTLMCTLAALVAAYTTTAQMQEQVVRAVGEAKTYRLAVNEALVSALEQHDGITISSSERQTMTHDSASTATRENGALDDRAKLEMNDAINKDMQKWAKGRILGYTVLSDVFDSARGRYRVEVDVRFPGAYVVGLDPANRRRMAVVPFRILTGDSFSWNGASESTAAWATELAARLSERLVQTRKFTVVDRDFDAETNAELARLADPNASAADSIRLKQKLGTDYLVVGQVRFFPVQPQAVNPLTGQVMPVSDQKFAEVAYRVLLAPTGQFKWGDTVTLGSAEFQAADIASFMTASADGAAMRITDGIMASILPFEVVGKTPSGLLIIGEGGKSIAEGEVFTVYALGDEMKDTRTGEVLDEVEEAVGDVQIVRVTEKMSYAKVLGGDAQKMVVGSRLRRPKAPAAAPAPVEPPTTTIRGNGTGGVVAPF